MNGGTPGKARLLQGNEAMVEGALYAGCRFFAGYPITPATEISEVMSYRLPAVDGTFIQMEDEIASMGAVIGASLAGAKAMTATSGPGFSLMQENLGFACVAEVPAVIVNVMRGGPSTGLHPRQPGGRAAGPLGHPRGPPHHRPGGLHHPGVLRAHGEGLLAGGKIPDPGDHLER